jgi:hypothetical protein
MRSKKAFLIQHRIGKEKAAEPLMRVTGYRRLTCRAGQAGSL